MKKVSFILVLLLIALSSGGKKKKKPSSGGGSLKDWLLGLRRPKTTAPRTTAKPTIPQVANKGGFNFLGINTTDKFYEVFKLPRLPQHREGYNRPGGGHSSAVEDNHPLLDCVARPTLVELPGARAHYGQLYYPSSAVLLRCSGVAFHYKLHACKPERVRVKTVEYYNIALYGQSSGKSMSVGSGIQMSYSLDFIDMEEHLSCSIQCIKTPDSCNATIQNWNSNECACECKPEYTSHKVACRGDFKYDYDTCSCVCAKAREECPYQIKKWSQSDCGCMCIEIVCPRGMDQDPTSCKCV